MRRVVARIPAPIRHRGLALGLLIAIPALSLTGCDLQTDPVTTGSTSEVGVPPPPPGTVHAVDISFATDEISETDVQCWKENYGAEHVIVGFNGGFFDVAERQLGTVLSEGMTADAYVWIDWTGDKDKRIGEVLSIIQRYPVRRLWIDVERAPDNRDSDLEPPDRRAILDASVEACGTFPCGIYTRKNWWDAEIGSKKYAHLPLWYALYDHQANFDDWNEDNRNHPHIGPFGGWSYPTGKQYDDPKSVAPDRLALCKNNVDWDIMYVSGDPGDDGDDGGGGGGDDTGPPPPAPTGLSPNGELLRSAPVTLSVDPMADVEEYEFVIQFDNGGDWAYYYTYWSPTGSQSFHPQVNQTSYRWKVRARNAHAWGDFSGWAEFYFNTESEPPPPPPGDPPPAPTGLDPNGEVLRSAPVELSWYPIADVDEYEVTIEYEQAGNWRHYYTYYPTTSAKAFHPQVNNTNYRWRVRARNAHGWGAFSGWAGFYFGVSEPPPPDPPPAPTGLNPNGEVLRSAPVELLWSPIANVSEYEIVINYKRDGAWYYYYTYNTTTAAKAFWPQYNKTNYRWKVRARNDGGWGNYSIWAGFYFDNS